VNREPQGTSVPSAPAGREGTLVPRVAVRLPMSRADEGHRQLEQGGLRGRVVLTFE